MADAFLLSAARTPIGKYLGALAEVPAPQLGPSPWPRPCAARERLERIDEVIMGNVSRRASARTRRARRRSRPDCPTASPPSRSTRCAARG